MWAAESTRSYDAAPVQVLLIMRPERGQNPVAQSGTPSSSRLHGTLPRPPRSSAQSNFRQRQDKNTPIRDGSTGGARDARTANTGGQATSSQRARILRPTQFQNRWRHLRGPGHHHPKAASTSRLRLRRGQGQLSGQQPPHPLRRLEHHHGNPRTRDFAQPGGALGALPWGESGEEVAVRRQARCRDGCGDGRWQTQHCHPVC